MLQIKGAYKGEFRAWKETFHAQLFTHKVRVLECGVSLFLHENLEGGILPWSGGAPTWGRTRRRGPMRRGDTVGTSHVSVGSARVVRHVTPTRIGRRCGGVDNINVGTGED